MKEKYLEFLNKASDIYNGPDGYNNLLRAINSGQFQDGLNPNEYEIVKTIMLDFFKERNTKGNNRTFGIIGHINDLLLKCEEKEKIISNLH